MILTRRGCLSFRLSRRVSQMLVIPPETPSTSAAIESAFLIADGFCGAVGNTPLIRLNRLTQETGTEILAKAEFMNPGGSVKDRAALYVILDAELSGRLKPGGVVVEGTAGNTGIGLAHICRARGYRCVIFMPNTQSAEKMALLRMLGAEVRAVAAVPYANPDNYQHQAQRYAESLENAVWTSQFDNQANRRAHIETTGPEIWTQTQGLVDGFTCAVGTGGTLMGVASVLKERSQGQCTVWLADPPGACMYNYVKHGVLERYGQGSITEGIGQGRITGNLDTFIDQYVDDAIVIPDTETITMVYRLLDEEGLYVGASSALNVVAATKLAHHVGKGKRVVTILCDGAYRYQSRLFSQAWLKEKGLWEVLPPHLQRYAVLP